MMMMTVGWLTWVQQAGNFNFQKGAKTTVKLFLTQRALRHG